MAVSTQEGEEEDDMYYDDSSSAAGEYESAAPGSVFGTVGIETGGLERNPA